MNGEAHSAWDSAQVNVSVFTTQFDFQISGTEPLADGFTFAIQGSGTSALGGNGSSYGFGGISNGVAVKFGLYGGSYTGLYSGTTIDVNAAVGMNFHSGDIMRVQLTYDGTTLYQTITDLSTGTLFTQNYTINIPAAVGGTTAWVGFTGATGGYNSIQSILNWTFATLPSAPSGLTAVPNSDAQVTVSWTDNAADEFGFQIQRANDSAFTVNAQTSASPALTTGTGIYIDTGLASNTVYYYRILATNAVGASAYTGAASVLTFCSAPANPAAIGGNGNVSLAWNASAGATSYNLYRSLASGSEGSIAYATGITSNSSTDSSVTNGTLYYYKVSAVNGSGAGPQSAEFTGLPSSTITIDQWKLQEFGSVPAALSPAAADQAIPDGDGISNLMKYALNLNPFVSGATGLPYGSVENIGGTNYLTLTFQRLHPAPADISYIVETSTDLSIGTWTPAVVVDGYPVNNGDGTETMEERDALPASTGSQFIRLRITRP